MKKLFALCLFLCTGLAQAATVTIDFETIAVGTPFVVDQGYRISGSVNGDETRLGVAEASGNNFFEAYSLLYEQMCACSAPRSDITIERDDGASFAFFGADLSGYMNTILTGYLAGGGTAADPVGTGDWLNVDRVVYSATAGFCTSFCFNRMSNVTVDNIVVGAAVPIPAAVWLFGSALAGMGFLRRRRQT
jgi:hypothetical protein